MEQSLSVTQLNKYIRLRLEQDDVLQQVCVFGELSNVTIHRSGHIYVKLKDENSVISAVMFRGDASRLSFRPKDGQKVLAYGRVSVYEPYGNYQLYISHMQPEGLGDLYLAFEKLKSSLAQEGLFDESHKKKIPTYPKTIGVITSPTGAAIRDILQILSRRYPSAQVILYPALVQGEEAAAQLIKGVRWFDENDAADVLIIGRGGGSMEDLWAFNDQMLAYEIYRCHIPVISAVGHEIDYTICDFVADLRAPTPSAAAELAVPDGQALRNKLVQMRQTLASALRYRAEQSRRQLLALRRHPALSDHAYLLSARYQKIDQLQNQLYYVAQNRLQISRQQLGQQAARLDALSPLKVLGRGYAIVEDDQCRPMSRVQKGETIYLRLQQQRAQCKVCEVQEKEGLMK